MTYKRFEELPAWQAAIALAEGCEEFILAAKDRVTWSKRDQLDRASLSVSNNIAEGFERGTTNELLSLLYIARGSAGEVRSMLCYFERRPALQDLRFQISDFEILGRELLAPDPGLGRFVAELAHQRPEAPQRHRAKPRGTAQARRGVFGQAQHRPPRRASREKSIEGASLKFHI